MKNKSPERFSFGELRSMVGGMKAGHAPVRFIGKELAMLGEGRKALQNILQPDTPYIMEDCRMGFIRKGRIRLTVNLIEREYGEGTFAFIYAGGILQINYMSEDFDLCGMMMGNERLNAALGGSPPVWYNGYAPFFTVHPQEEDAAAVKRLEQSGMLRRMADDKDMRCNRLALTREGRAYVEACQKSFDGVDALAFRGFSGEECEALYNYLQRLTANLETEEFRKRSVSSLLDEEKQLHTAFKRRGKKEEH